MEILVCCIIFVVGVAIGVFIGKARSKAVTMGRLRIDHSEPYEPAQMFVELKGVTPDMIARNKIVAFEVINESYLSRD